MKRLCLYLVLFLSLVLVFSPFTKQAVYASAEAKDNSESEFNITSKAGLLYDAKSKTIIYSKNSEERLPIASMTKLASLMLIFEAIDEGILSEDTMIRVSKYAASVEGSSAFLDAGSEYKAGDLIMTVIVCSANDSTVALAETVAGSEENFVRKMNEKAKEMGLKNTNFMNSTGLPAVDHYSSACDISKIYATICDNKIYKKYSKIWMTELIHPSKRKTDIVNTNRLIRTYEGCDSGKTGFTSEAGFCLSASATRGGMRLIGIVIGADSSKTRFNEMANMFNYGFASYENKVIIEKDKAIAEAKVTNSKQKSVNVYPKEDFVKFIKKGEDFEYSLSFNLGSIKAPKQSEDGVGKLYVLDKNNIVVYETELVIRQDIEEIKIKDILKKIYTLI